MQITNYSLYFTVKLFYKFKKLAILGERVSFFYTDFFIFSKFPLIA
jgi:hypothetical protein